MTNWTSDDAQLVKALFGRPVRVVVAEWVLKRSGQSFFLSECQGALVGSPGAAGSAVRAELELFVSVGMLERFESERRVYFTQTAHFAWPAFAAIADAFATRRASNRRSAAKANA